MRDPFLCVVPLSTLSHWRKEVETWTDMNAIIYHDAFQGKKSREVIRNHEFYFKNRQGKYNISRRKMKFNIMITTYEVITADLEVLMDIPWEMVVIDEGHRIKSQFSRLLHSLKMLNCNRRLLMTGTPIQNNTQELWSLLNFLEPDEFANLEHFTQNFGNLSTKEEVEKLQARIKPYIIRRMKETVENSIPPKEEVIIDIELTTLQKKYYRAIYERNIGFLQKGCKGSNRPRLVNVEMELRKCCNHPWLIAGAEDKEFPDDVTEREYMATTISASGKLVLLDKLLPKLKEEGHRILIFSQMQRVLDILEEYIQHKFYKYERLDGSVTGNDRTEALKRFCKPGSDRFIFLLSTHAGGVGLNLVAADTVIFYDHDWNPQQDIQAMARVHRIGQTRKVMIYHLITRNTYETEMWERASKKLGLNKAVLSNIEMGAGKEELGEGEMERMLKLGAYAMLDDEGIEEKKFLESDIDTILATSSRKLVTGAGGADENGGNNATKMAFDKITFTSEDADQNLDINDPNFWQKLVPQTDMERFSPDLLLSQLTDGSAVEDKATFFDRVRKHAEHNIKLRAEGELAPDLDSMINLLIQFSITGSSFSKSQLSKASSWLQILEQRVERRARKRNANDESQGSKRTTKVRASNLRTSRRGARDGDGSSDEEASDVEADSDEDSDEDSDQDSGSGSGSDSNEGARRSARKRGSRQRGRNRNKDTNEEYVYTEEERPRRGRPRGSGRASKRVKNPGVGRGRGKTVLNNAVCDACYLPGMLITCEGLCRRSFHLQCTEPVLEELPSESEPWLCNDCSSGMQKCHVCQKKDRVEILQHVEGTGVYHCSVMSCGMYYHLECARNLDGFSFFNKQTKKGDADSSSATLAPDSKLQSGPAPSLDAGASADANQPESMEVEGASVQETDKSKRKGKGGTKGIGSRGGGQIRVLPGLKFRCAHHFCMKCKTRDSKRSTTFIRCVTCPNAVHSGCKDDSLSRRIVRLTRNSMYCPACLESQRRTRVGSKAIEAAKAGRGDGAGMGLHRAPALTKRMIAKSKQVLKQQVEAASRAQVEKEKLEYKRMREERKKKDLEVKKEKRKEEKEKRREETQRKRAERVNRKDKEKLQSTEAKRQRQEEKRQKKEEKKLKEEQEKQERLLRKKTEKQEEMARKLATQERNRRFKAVRDLEKCSKQDIMALLQARRKAGWEVHAAGPFNLTFKLDGEAKLTREGVQCFREYQQWPQWVAESVAKQLKSSQSKSAGKTEAEAGGEAGGVAKTDMDGEEEEVTEEEEGSADEDLEDTEEEEEEADEQTEDESEDEASHSEGDGVTDDGGMHVNGVGMMGMGIDSSMHLNNIPGMTMGDFVGGSLNSDDDDDDDGTDEEKGQGRKRKLGTHHSGSIPKKRRFYAHTNGGHHHHR